MTFAKVFVIAPSTVENRKKVCLVIQFRQPKSDSLDNVFLPSSVHYQNHETREVLAYDRYSIERHENFQPFRKVDAIRLLEFWLDRWVSLDVMQEQGVISAYYPCPDPEELVTMHHTILSCGGFLPANQLMGIISVRAYFGDQIAFFFRFIMHLCNSLLYLAFLGAAFWICRRVVFDSELGLHLRQFSFCTPHLSDFDKGFSP